MSVRIRMVGRWALALCLALMAGQAFASCAASAWTSETGAVQPVGGGGDDKYEQDCGLTVTAETAPGYLTTTAPENETSLFTRFYMYPAQLNLSSGDADVFVARDGTTPQVRLALRQIGEALNLVVFYRSGGILVESSPIPLRPVWQGINVNWTTGAGTGALVVKVDGFERLNAQSLDNAGEFVNELDLGIINDPDGAGPVVLDAFEARRTLPEPALLTINELLNVSTRAAVGDNVRAVVGGFIIEGDTAKCVVVRGRGESVNISLPTLEDPRLVLKRAGDPTVLKEVDNWQDDDEAATLVELGLAPTVPNESAFFTCLDPGAYTAELRSVSDTMLGIGIVEVFDADLGTPYLINLSTRAEVFAGGRRAVAGFAIRGSVSRTVLIRGRGPSVNVTPQKLADPTLEIRSTADGEVLATNNDWQIDSNTGSAVVLPPGDIPANLQPGVDVESAIMVELPPGNYTAFLGSADDVYGIGIIEVFDLDGGSIEPN